MDDTKLRLQLGDSDGAILLPLYVDATRLPSGVLPGCSLVVGGLRIKTSQATSQPYAELSSTASIQVFRAPTNDFCFASVSVRHSASAAEPNVNGGSSLLADIVPHGPQLLMLRLLLTVRQIYSLHLWMVCAHVAGERSTVGPCPRRKRPLLMVARSACALSVR
jgi:hypothetical protein